MIFFFFFFNDTATTEIYTLSLHDALPIFALQFVALGLQAEHDAEEEQRRAGCPRLRARRGDRKSTRLNSSHGYISYAVFCLKKKQHNTPWRLLPKPLSITQQWLYRVDAHY